MRIGVHPVTFRFPGGDAAIPHGLTRLARATERAGCGALLLMDHHFQIPGVGAIDDPMLEGYTTLGYLAAITERVQLGLLVTGVTYRHPGLLAKIVATLDVLSGGRAMLGLGAAWFRREHDGLGVPFPPLGERFERLEDALRVAHQMWSDDNGPFEGHHVRMAETICAPAPLRRPHPPIMVGGGGERRTLRLVAEYADASNIVPRSAEEVAHKMDVLDRHCRAVGRDPDAVERTVLVVSDPFADLPAFLEDLRRFARLGIAATYLVPPAQGDAVAFVERVGAEIVPVAGAL